MGYIITQASEDLLPQIKSLQLKNLKASLTPEEVETEGFVTCDHTIPLLTKMNQPDGHIVTVYKGQVVGYCLVMSPVWREALDVLKPMFEKIDSLSYQGRQLSQSKYVTMGQVCIARAHRKKGLFKRMYNHFRDCLSPSYEYCITEIATENMRSRTAHEYVGFEDLHSYEAAGGLHWKLVIWDWTKG